MSRFEASVGGGGRGKGLESRSREILICYSVCLRHDEKHSFANPLEEKHIGGGLVVLLVGMAAESCLAAHRQTELLSALKAFMLSDLVQRGRTRSPQNAEKSSIHVANPSSQW